MNLQPFFTLRAYSTLMTAQLSMVGVTAGILMGSPSQPSSSPAGTARPPLTAANLALRVRVFPPAQKVCVWHRAASGWTRREVPLVNVASREIDSPEKKKGLGISSV